MPEHLLRLRENMLWHAPAAVIEEFLAMAGESLKAIERSNDVRHIVLEAWLLVDLVLRKFLLGGLDLHKLNHPEYDLRYELLPRSFEGLLRMIARVRDVNATLAEPVPDRTTMPIGLFSWLRRQHRDFLDRFLELERLYFVEECPEALPPCDREPAMLTTQAWPPDDPRRVSAAWLKSAQQITESWGRRARQLNRARNLAAHSHNRPAIAAALGYTGEEALSLVRLHCITLADELLGITRLNPEGLAGSA